jgi:hypothetical protein
MTIEEYILKLDSAKQGVQSFPPEVLIGVAVNAITLIRRRVVEQGVNAEGRSFQDIRPYRPDYQEYKAKRGRYRGFVDFTLEGRMWPSTQLALDQAYVDRSSVTPNSITIRPLSEENREKLVKNTRKWGPILAISRDEANQLRKALSYDLRKLIEGGKL